MKTEKRPDGTTKITKAISRNFFSKDAATLYCDLLKSEGLDAWVTENHGSERHGK